MCILLKLDYAKFSVSNLFFSKGIEKKPLGPARRPPPPSSDKGRVNIERNYLSQPCSPVIGKKHEKHSTDKKVLKIPWENILSDFTQS